MRTLFYPSGAENMLRKLLWGFWAFWIYSHCWQGVDPLLCEVIKQILTCNSSNVILTIAFSMPLCNHCAIYYRVFCLVFILGVLSLDTCPECSANSHNCQTPSLPGEVHYVPAEKCTIKCSSIKSGVFLIAHSPLKERIPLKCSTLPKLWPSG